MSDISFPTASGALQQADGSPATSLHAPIKSHVAPDILAIAEDVSGDLIDAKAFGPLTDAGAPSAPPSHEDRVAAARSLGLKAPPEPTAEYKQLRAAVEQQLRNEGFPARKTEWNDRDGWPRDVDVGQVPHPGTSDEAFQALVDATRENLLEHGYGVVLPPETGEGFQKFIEAMSRAPRPDTEFSRLHGETLKALQSGMAFIPAPSRSVPLQDVPMARDGNAAD